MSHDPNDEIQQRIEELMDRIPQLSAQEFDRSALRVALELKRTAKAEGLVVPYLIGCFYVMNSAQTTFDTELGIENAIEAIPLLESEEKAREFQPDLPEDHYYYTVHWMTACAYDNLATHIACRDGYNSDGVHDVVNDGIQVCRRTSKLECVTCFREYAMDVFRAANDLDMALHYARTSINTPPRDETHDRRWVGQHEEARILLLQGQLEAAQLSILKALAIRDSHHAPIDARLTSQLILKEILLLRGLVDQFDTILAEADCPFDETMFPPKGESPKLELGRDLNRAVEHCCQSEFDAAVALLADWDRKLTTFKRLDDWFEVRLRLIATHLLARNNQQATRLAEPLEIAAKKAHDWLTLARLKGMLQSLVVLSPSALAATASCGPFGRTETDPVSSEQPTGPDHAEPVTSQLAAGEIVTPHTEDVTESPGETQEEPPSPRPSDKSSAVRQHLEQLWESISAANPEDRETRANEVLTQVMQQPCEEVDNAEDAAYIVFFASQLAWPTERITQLWSWAAPLATRFANEATLLNVMATLGSQVHAQAEDADQLVSMTRVDEMFAVSLDLDPERSRNFARAGFHYLNQNRLGEAERTFARAFRLDRTASSVAIELARIYSGSDRSRDALAVLDLCIRNGADDPELLWDAGTTALYLARYEASLTYFDRYKEMVDDNPWADYYRACCLLDCDRPAEALEAVAAARLLSAEGQIHLDILEACGIANTDGRDAFCQKMNAILQYPLRKAEHLTVSGIGHLLERLYRTLIAFDHDGDQVERLEQLLLETGSAPNELFDRHRAAEKHSQSDQDDDEEVEYFVVEVRQPLDDRWNSFSGCLAGQEGWEAYTLWWGVLAADEDQATQVALHWQSKCFPLPATVSDVEPQDEAFDDSPAAVWQGLREPVEEDGD